ncbi:unnamed protein product [Choristocarpus tenellus]
MGACVSSPAVVFVLGASGMVGSETVKKMLSHPSKSNLDVVAGVRDPAKVEGKFPGARVVAATMGSPELAGVLKDENAGILVVITPGSEDRAEVVTRTVASAKESGVVKHVVVVSVTTAETGDGIFGKQFVKLETNVKAEGIPYTFIRFPLFMENYLGQIGAVQNAKSVYLPLAEDAKFSELAVSDAADCLTAVAFKPGKHSSKTYTVSNEPHNVKDVVAALSIAVGETVSFVQATDEQCKESLLGVGLPGWQADGIVELYAMCNAGNYTYPNGPETVKNLSGHMPMTVAEWVDKKKGAFATIPVATA